WIGVVLSLVMTISFLMPITTLPVYAADLAITGVTQGTSYLYPEDQFSLKVKVAKEGDAAPIKITSVYVGGAVDDANVSYDIIYWDDVNGNNTIIDASTGVEREKTEDEKSPQEVIIKGLKYTGRGHSATVGIGYAGGSVSKEITLSGMTLEETQAGLKVDDSANVLVKADATQNAQVKVINQGTKTLKNVKVKLELAEKVEGIKIKTEEAIISQLQPKEIKTASFSVEVGSDVKAKVYKATATVNGASFPINLQVDSHIVPSLLEVSTNDTKIFTPGVSQDATFTIKNVGERVARNIRVEFSSENVAVVSGGNVKHIPVINAKGSSDITLKLRVDSKVTQGTVPLKIDMTYLNSLGEEAKDTQSVYLSTSASSVSSEVVIGNVVSPLGTYGVDENFTVKFDVSSKGEAENLKISVKGDEGIVPKSQNLFFISKLKAGEKKQYAVTLAATRAAVSSTHPLEIAIEYGDGEEPTKISQYSSVNISNPDKDEEGTEVKKGTPKVIIGHYKSEPVVVRAGEQFDLEIGFLNAHQTQAVHNLKASLAVREEGKDNTGSVFTPVGASNTFYIADLMPGQTEVKKIRLYTIPSASPKTYEVTLEMEYEDNKGNEVKATEAIGIPVEQITQVEVGDIQVDYAQIGMPTYFNATIYNTGKTDISNMMIHIEGEGFTVQENKMFVGSFEKGATENYAPTIIPDMPGMLTGNMIIEYEEATGEVKQIMKEFTLEVAEMAPPEDMPMDDPGMMPAQPVAKIPLMLGIGAGVMISIIVTSVVLKKRKAKKEEMMLNEDD
ncbi:MAG: hypothetical protein K0R69_3298, partial [Clostridia bacterium]|nr:hypothetical protein [Clostridia bacterium]